ncbi:MAG TPA: hypothetical protein VK034_28780 [Enhygromyxa sp.]|nr:hypothetical protein [Enhygromyxa sp.]
MAFSALVMFGAVACSGDSVSAESGNTTTTTNNGTEDEATEATTIDDTSESGMVETETDTDDGPDDTTLSTGSFYALPEDLSDSLECDPIYQDCPEGEKCVPYASSGGAWDANKCVPILGDGEPGEPCTYNGAFEATDDCDGSSMCWNVIEVDGEWVGTCIPFCAESWGDPQCPEGSTCLIANDSKVTVCVETCDPLAQDCPDGQGCHLAWGEFVCLSDLSDDGQSCDVLAQCPPGDECVSATLVPECDGTACCTPYCSLDDPMCDPQTECVPVFDADPPPGYENVGLCLVPG